MRRNTEGKSREEKNTDHRRRKGRKMCKEKRVARRHEGKGERPYGDDWIGVREARESCQRVGVRAVAHSVPCLQLPHPHGAVLAPLRWRQEKSNDISRWLRFNKGAAGRVTTHACAHTHKHTCILAHKHTNDGHFGAAGVLGDGQRMALHLSGGNK